MLCDLAAELVGGPVRHVCIPPRDLRSCRTNILLALDHLGLLMDFDQEGVEQAIGGGGAKVRGEGGGGKRAKGEGGGGKRAKGEGGGGRGEEGQRGGGRASKGEGR